jgi:tetratricopeptide (TPR) repeat protein
VLIAGYAAFGHACGHKPDLMKKSPLQADRATSTAAFFLLLACPLVAGAFFSDGWSWGWDHLHRAGPLWTAFVLSAGAVLWIPAVSRKLDAAFRITGEVLERKPHLAAVIAAFGLAAFAAFPIATRMYGDSKVIVDDHTPRHLALYLHRLLSFTVMQRGSAVFAFHDILSRLTGISFERAFMLVSVLCGGVFLLVMARLTARLPSVPGWVRATILWLAITDGANQMFFGHVEIYSLPRLVEVLFLAEVVRSLLLEPQRVSAAARARTVGWFLLAVFLHLQAIVLLPTLILWGARLASGARPALRPWAGRRLAGIGIAAALLGFSVVYGALGSFCYDYIYSGGNPHPRQIFIPVSTACVGLPYLRYTMFSGAHLLDFFGGLWSTTSAAILLVLALLLPRAWKDERLFVLLPSVMAALLHDFLLNTGIGYSFDWDLMSVVSPPLLFTAVFVLARESSPVPRRGLLPALVFLGLGTATIFGVNAGRERAFQRVEDMGIWLHKTWYGGSHFRLSANLSSITDPRRQIAARERVMTRLLPDAYPDDREVAFLWEKLASKWIEVGEYPRALENYRRALATEPSNWYRMKAVGYLESEVGSAAEGVRLLSDYVKRAPEDPEGWVFLGDAFARVDRTDLADGAWRRYLELDPGGSEAARVRGQLRGAGAPSPGPDNQ